MTEYGHDLYVRPVLKQGSSLMVARWVQRLTHRSFYGVYALCLGWISSIRSRQFKWAPFAAALLVTLLGTFLGHLYFHLGFNLQLDEESRGWIWLLLTGGPALMGTIVFSVWVRRWSAAELQAVMWIQTLFAYALLQIGLSQIVPPLNPALQGWGFEPVLDGIDFMNASFGTQLLGPAWQVTFLIAFISLWVFAFALHSIFFLCLGERPARWSWGPETFLAWHYLRTEKITGSASIALVGIILSLGLVVAVNAVMSGYLRDVQRSLLQTNAHLVIREFGRDFDEYPQVAEQAMGVKEVIAWTPYVYSEAVISSAHRSEAVSLKGVDVKTAPEVIAIDRQLCVQNTEIAGSCKLSIKQNEERPDPIAPKLSSYLRDPNHILLGHILAKTLQAKIGDIVFLTVWPSGGSLAPKKKAFEVAGVFKSGIYQFDAHLAYTPIQTGQAFLDIGDRVHGIELKVREPMNMASVHTKVRRAIQGSSFSLIDWQQLNRPIFSGLRKLKASIFFLVSLTVVVAAFNVASVQFMTVVKRSKDMGILRSIGARPSGTLRVLVLQGWLLGLLGTAAGLLLGVMVAKAIGWVGLEISAEVYMVSDLKILLKPMDLVLAAGTTLLICHFATFIPALQGAALQPVEAIRTH